MKRNVIAVLIGFLVCGLNSSAMAVYVADDVVCTECVNDTDIAAGTITASKVGYYHNVIIVAPNGKGHFTDPVSAVASITDASPSNPYLVKLMPGIYDIEAGSVIMKPYVDLEGSGENVTKVTGNKECIHEPSGVFFLASNSEIRNLTVEHSGGVSYAVGIYNGQTISTKITNVRVIVTGSGSYSAGISSGDSTSTVIKNTSVSVSGGGYVNGVASGFGSVSMINVKITASGWWETSAISNNGAGTTIDMENVSASASGGSNCYGIYNSPNLTMRNVTATASGGTNNYGAYIFDEGWGPAIVKLDNSSVTGSTNALYNGLGMTTYVGNSRLEGGSVANYGSIACIGAYDATYKGLTSKCR